MGRLSHHSTTPSLHHSHFFMRIVTYVQNEMERVGVMLDDQYVADVNAGHLEWLKSQENVLSLERQLVGSVKDFLEQGRKMLETVQNVNDYARELFAERMPEWIFPVERVQLLAPVPNPSKVVAIGQNYRDHCREQNAQIPERPIIFAKFPTSVIGPGDSIVWDPDVTTQVDYEAELGVVIGKHARHVSQADAFDYIAGYLNGNDVSARDLQFGDRQWVRGKSLDTFCPLGPYLVTRDEVSDPHNLRIRAILNGEAMQDSNTGMMIFTIPVLIEFITQAFTLLPGDIILTGTPHGVGVFRDPKVFLKPGDTITIEIEGLGSLTNPVGNSEQ